MKARIEAMGPVNMMALEEYKECEQRDEFLRRERDDLLQSIQNTQHTIHELDEVSRQKFEEAFAFINAQFAIAFQTLFGGGNGEMRLTEPDSSGDCGIDIVAQPPGKRLQNILLLSGGEKALTALALLIAIFRYQPSPSASSTKWTRRSTKPTSAASTACSRKCAARRSSSSSRTIAKPWKWDRCSTASPCRSPASPSSFP